MKKYVSIIIVAIILAIVGLLYYSYQGNETSNNEEPSNVEEAPEKDTREIIWEQLSAQRKEEVDGSWTDGEVSKITLSDDTVMRATGDASYVGEEVYLISFPSKLNPTLGDLIVYADMNTAVIIGYGLRD